MQILYILFSHFAFLRDSMLLRLLGCVYISAFYWLIFTFFGNNVMLLETTQILG